MAKYLTEITAACLREMLHYDQVTGVFTWLVQANNNGAPIGSVAGSPMRSARYSGTYITIGIGGRSYLAHRLAWLWMTGEWPCRGIDHRDLDKSNNRWDNLRQATQSQNNANGPLRRDNKLGVKGVTFNARYKRPYLAWVGTGGGIQTYLGCFDTLEAASAARTAAAAAAQFGKFARAS